MKFIITLIVLGLLRSSSANITPLVSDSIVFTACQSGTNALRNADSAALSNGGWIIVGTMSGQIWLREYNSAGTPSAQVTIATNGIYVYVTIADVLSNGNIVLGFGGDNNNLVFKMASDVATLASITSFTQIGSCVLNQIKSKILTNGNIAYCYICFESSYFRAYAAVISPTGQIVMAHTLVNPVLQSGDQRRPAVIIRPNGFAYFCYTNLQPTNPEVKCFSYDPANGIGSGFDPDTNYNNNFFSGDLCPNGDLFTAWVSNPSASGQVKTKKFTANGVAIGQELLVGTAGPGTENITAHCLSDNRLVLVWSYNGQIWHSSVDSGNTLAQQPVIATVFQRGSRTVGDMILLKDERMLLVPWGEVTETGQPGDCPNAFMNVICSKGTHCTNPASSACVQGSCAPCSSNTDCYASAGKVCKSSNQKCVECDLNSDCSGGTPKCDQNSFTCQQCLVDGDCSSPTPRCDKKTFTCKQCLGGGDCSSPTPICFSKTCKQCVDNGDCPSPTPICNNYTCKQCLVDGDCSSPTPKCDGYSFTCKQCHSTGDCPLGQTCNSGTCVNPQNNPGCSSDLDCIKSNLGTKCQSGTCGCQANTDCTSTTWTDGTFCDIANKKCICNSDNDCKSSIISPKCDTTSKKCACSTNGDCSGVNNICDTTSKTCVRCKIDSDCPNGNKCNPESMSCMASTLSSNRAGALSKNNRTPCSTDLDCSQALEGSKCDLASKTCSCASSTHCSSWTYGQVCNTATQTCGCSNDKQCAGSYLGIACDTGKNQCGCQSSSSCQLSYFSTLCADSSICACKTDFDCLRSRAGSTCNTFTNRCSCSGDTKKCGANQNGAVCQTESGKWKNVCTCTKDSECSSNNYGPKCNTQLTPAQCTCSNNGDCANSPVGSICTSRGVCGCSTNSDCSGNSAFGALCDNSGPYASYECATCLVDSDCKGEKSICDFGTRKCVQCLNNGHCLSGLKCNLNTRTCWQQILTLPLIWILSFGLLYFL